MKILLVNDTSENPNWGCRATCAAIKKILENKNLIVTETISNKQLTHPDYLSSLKYSSLFDKGILQYIIRSKLCSSIIRNVYKSNDTIPGSFSDFDSFAQNSTKFPVILTSKQKFGCKQINLNQAIHNCDVVYINGEGSTHSDRRIFRSIMFTAYLAKNYYKKPVIIGNHSLRTGTNETNAIASSIYPQLDDYIFREPLSITENSHILTDADDDRLVPDAAFLWSPINRKEFIKKYQNFTHKNIIKHFLYPIDFSQPYIGITLGSGFEKIYRNSAEQIDLVLKLLQEVKKLNKQILLLAHGKSEAKIFKRVSHIEKMPLLQLDTPIQDVTDILANASIIVGGRWHSAILGLTGGTPFLSFSANTTKMQGLHALTKNSDRVFDVKNLQSEIPNIVSGISKTLANESELRKHFSNIAKQFRINVHDHARWF